MTGRLKTAEQRANEVVQNYLDWASRNKDLTKRLQILRDLIYVAIDGAEAAIYARIRVKYTRPPLAPKAFPPFPFADHRTLAQVDQAKEPA